MEGVISLTHGGKLVGLNNSNWFSIGCGYLTILVQCHSELGGIAIAPHPNLDLKQLKPGFIMKPSFGVIPHLFDKDVCISIY